MLDSYITTSFGWALRQIRISFPGNFLRQIWFPVKRVIFCYSHNSQPLVRKDQVVPCDSDLLPSVYLLAFALDLVYQLRRVELLSQDEKDIEKRKNSTLGEWTEKNTELTQRLFWYWDSTDWYWLWVFMEVGKSKRTMVKAKEIRIRYKWKPWWSFHHQLKYGLLTLMSFPYKLY